MALPDILRNHVGTALDRVENYIDGVDTTFNPKNTLNRIRILLTTVRDHMQSSTKKGSLSNIGLRCKAEADLARELNSQQIILNLQNNPPGNMATIQDVMTSIAPLLAQIPQYERVASFSDAMKVTVLSGKMEGRFISPNPFNNGAGNPVNTPALFQI
ncbi:hypothetical protein RhiirA1_458655 [Rhizophagus irregularis]|uniref:Uncharacterized protein n=2 Tax=Rhizophagus irregularis TaxID=588596 RepID=A0A2N0RVC4_9GLOM|nr:hypothetical protein RhiirA1_458655 [Rhizophagus irregularis]CAB5217272.1 unnamed protein product [Rhizophagus irregularis]